MIYNLVYTRRVVKDIQKIEPMVKKRIGDTLLRYQEDPIRYARKMINSDL